MRLLRMKVVLTDGPRSGTLARVAEVVIHAPPAVTKSKLWGAETVSLECGVHRDSRSLRSRLENGLEYISAAMLLVPLEGDLNASVGIVRDEIEDGAVLPIAVSKCAIAALD